MGRWQHANQSANHGDTRVMHPSLKRVLSKHALLKSVLIYASVSLSAWAVAGDASDIANLNNAVTVSLMGPALRSSDLERSIKYYTAGLGMTVAATLKHGTVTEVIFSFGAPSPGQPVLLLFKDEAQDKSPPIEHGNGFDRVVLRTASVSALSARLAAAGYAAGEIHDIPANHMKVMTIEDPDGYRYEITEPSAPRT
jgi:catechol 2,3-dioxygenase-like lactoylglutathione lyase family enzyme